jgi:hypothetical protein
MVLEESAAEVVEESPVESPAEPADPRPKRGSRSRGGASRSRQAEPRSRRPARTPPLAEADSASSAKPAPAASSSQRRPPVGADKHLADDVPVDHDPPPRPRSYTDLDEIHGELD